MKKIVIGSYMVGMVQTNFYYMHLKDSAETIVFDPADLGDRIWEALHAQGLEVRAIFLTHAHFDHIGGVAPLMEEGTRLLIHPLDEPMLSDPDLNAGRGLLRRDITAPEPTDRVREGDELTIADLDADLPPLNSLRPYIPLRRPRL